MQFYFGVLCNFIILSVFINNSGVCEGQLRVSAHALKLS